VYGSKKLSFTLQLILEAQVGIFAPFMMDVKYIKSWRLLLVGVCHVIVGNSIAFS